MGQRNEDALRRLELQVAQSRMESRLAQQHIDAFVARARRQGLPTVRLAAGLLGSAAKVRTDRKGWYIRANHSVAVGTDGSFFVLTVPGGWRERLTGVRLKPQPPPLIVARGGRDGESGELVAFLERTLAEGPW